MAAGYEGFFRADYWSRSRPSAEQSMAWWWRCWPAICRSMWSLRQTSTGVPTRWPWWPTWCGLTSS